MQFLLFFGVFFTLFAAVNYYIGIRGWQAFGGIIPVGYGKVYWIVFFLLAFSYLLGRFGSKYLPVVVSDGLILAGSYWLAAMHFFFFTLVLIDLARLADRWLGFLPEAVKQFPAATGLAVILLVVLITAYGSWNARTPRLVHYDITIPKEAGKLEELHAVVVSDIHLGKIVNNGRLTSLVQRINDLEPDVVLLPGDIIDENISTFVEQKMAESFRLVKSRYGTYAVFGNHEYIGGHSEEAAYYLREAGVTVLRDSSQMVAGSFYIVGRDQRSQGHFGGGPRKDLADIMAGLDRSLPVFLLDHQPTNLNEGREQGVDLQLSGHTHLGQLFPWNLVTRKVFEIDWGYLRKGDFQVIVSCGFGTWGPPVRIGNRPEIVDVTVHFAPAAKESPGA